MMKKASVVHSHLSARNVRALTGFKAEQFESLAKIGIGLDKAIVNKMMREIEYQSALDAIQPLVTTPSVATPVQFLQEWLSGQVFIITAARKIDEMIGRTITGNWEDEQVVQTIMELVGSAVPYGDLTDVPFGSWNANFETRTVVRAEEGIMVKPLASARAARMRVDDAATKRQAAALALEIFRNTVGFFGFNNGSNRTYGFLNEPNLPAYVTVANGASGSPLWSSKTYLEITKDIRTAVSALRTRSGDNIDPRTAKLTLGIASNSVDFLSTVSEFGNSVADWIAQTYPSMRIVSAPQLNAANGGANVFYLFADEINDGYSTDGGRTFIQAVPTQFQALGVQQLAKGYEEDYANATAGAFLVRPWAVVRYSGI